FIKLALIYSLIETISNPMVTGAQATGKIKIYQIVVGSFIFLTLPTVWLVFKLTNDPLNMYYVLIGNSIIALIIRIGFLIKMMNLNIYTFIKDVIFKILFVVLLAVCASFLVNLLINFNNDVINFFVKISLITMLNILIISTVGLTLSERKFVLTFVKSKVKI